MMFKEKVPVQWTPPMPDDPNDTRSCSSAKLVARMITLVLKQILIETCNQHADKRNFVGFLPPAIESLEANIYSH